MKALPQKIAIIGIGLIGGSIALGLKKRLGNKITILGACKTVERSKKAKRSGIIDQTLNLKSKNLKKQLSEVELVILAIPQKELGDVLKLVIPNTPHDCLIIDTASTKKSIADKTKNHAFFIGTHPLAGTEKSGFENAAPDLFDGKSWVICKKRATKSPDLQIVKHLISILGAKPLIMQPGVHDELVTWTSHLPLVTSSILLNCTVRQKQWRDAAKIATTGLRDTTRLASDNPQMKTDIVFTNKENVIKALEDLKGEINNFLQLIKKNEEKEILQYFQKTKAIREMI